TRAEVIDRILAVVGRDLITLSDTVAARTFGLVPPPPAGGDVVRTTLDILIARQLELAEANRYQPSEPAAANVDARLDEVRRRAGGPQAWSAALAQSGVSEEQLRLRLRDDLRIDAFLAQRFGSARQPSEPELQAYYQAHQADYPAPGGGVRPFSDVRDAIRTQLSATQRVTLVNEWLDGLRRRTEILDLYVTAK
ncbi:MAG: hypothetical protein ABIX28_17050, partial [Vicinamibacterales bacterium]